MTRKEIKKRQQLLRDAGFDVAVDGIDGDTTQHAWEIYQLRQGSVDKAKAAAEQAKAAAEAERAKSEAEAIRAKAEIARQQAEAKRRADEAAEKQRAFDRELKDRADKEAREAREGLRKAGINATALAAGLAAGLAYAKKIDARRIAAVTAGAPKLAELAKDARVALKQYEAGKLPVGAVTKRLSGIAIAADAAKLTAKAPVGIGPAAVLLAEGALSRFVIARSFKDETTREAFQALGTTSAVAATTIIGKGAVNAKTPTVAVNARDLAAIEGARAVSSAEQRAVRSPVKKTRAPAQPSSAAGKIVARSIEEARPVLRAVGKGAGATLRAVGKLALPVALGVTVAQSLTGTAEAAEARPGEGDGERRLREFTEMAQARGQLAFDAADTLSFGLLSAAAALTKYGVEAVQHRMSVPAPSTVPSHGRAYLNDAAARRAEIKVRAANVVANAQGTAQTRSGNGVVAGYTRRDGTRVAGYRRN